MDGKTLPGYQFRNPENIPCRQYKPWKRNSLSTSELKEIIDEYMMGKYTYKNIAQRYRVTI